MKIEKPKNLNNSGYQGSGFKYLPEEWEEEMKKLMTQGKNETQARTELTHMEEVVRARQKADQEDRSERINIPA
ncbi:hypothetical protein A3F97_02490 [Candidatus Nomurabacteria bacterium RIFCSPLOWO2_12_FULL_41_10]|uniref:Uncharacterized protein n=1 Tax=Candidatus Nomurabacteria bacterium RIFCSPLOWO2_12_FULL_41_10 TaxID=1801795 RepID=A0A1F6YDB5_9BACT|nr:MAG: hypothetical protein A3F97_02490 [Candidatus Nomurabacteria bacterium RIFCSPLOWO2_12_FULL_41_10]